MKIARGSVSMRIMLTEEEYLELSDNKRLTRLWISLNPKSEDEFVALSEYELPHSQPISFSRSTAGAKWPGLFTMAAGPKWDKLLPDKMFGPEEVELRRDLSYASVGGWVVARPPMVRTPNSKPDFVSKPKTKTKTNPKAVARQQRVPVEEAAMSLRAAVDKINDAKAEYGADLHLEINKDTGRLLLFIQYGG